jgi:hypothetical protein
VPVAHAYSNHQLQGANFPLALWVDGSAGSHKLQGAGVGEVYNCSGDRENDVIVRVRVHACCMPQYAACVYARGERLFRVCGF